MLLPDRFLKLDDLESFLEDAERSAAANDDEKVDQDDPEDRLGEGASSAQRIATLQTSCC